MTVLRSALKIWMNIQYVVWTYLNATMFILRESVELVAANSLFFILRLCLKHSYEKKLEVQGEDVWLALQGKPVLLVANHASHLDFIVLKYFLDYRLNRKIRFLAKKELWENLLWRLLMKYGHSIPVDRTHFSIASMRAIQRAFANNQLIGMFPEGTRAYDGLVQPAKQGLEFLIRRHPDITFLPCGLKGFYEAWPKNKSLTWPLPKEHRMYIAFGEPRTFSGSDIDSAKSFSELLMTDVARLAQQSAFAQPEAGNMQEVLE